MQFDLVHSGDDLTVRKESLQEGDGKVGDTYYTLINWPFRALLNRDLPMARSLSG